MPCCSAFSETEEEALKEVKPAEELWFKTAKKEGRTIPQPVAEKKYSGKLSLRVQQELSKRLVVEAKEEKVSINQFIVYKLAVGGAHPIALLQRNNQSFIECPCYPVKKFKGGHACINRILKP